MGEKQSPFVYLTSEQFLKLSAEERIAYFERVAKHLAELVDAAKGAAKRDSG